MARLLETDGIVVGKAKKYLQVGNKDLALSML
jgi:hypothetical protein